MSYFYSPSLIYGEGALNFLENVSGEKCFIVTDKNIEETGILKILTDKLESLGKEFEIFNDVVPDPHEDGVYKAKEKCISYDPDIIIALGGGSVMDTAKATWILYELPQITLDEITFNKDLYNIDTGKKAKMIIIPTTSGTGSEVSIGMVISRFQEHANVWRKMEIPHMGLIPTYAIVDPVFPMSMPPELTVNTGFDALSHALESVVSSWRSDISDAVSLKAVELIFKYLPIVYKDGKNKEGRDKMHLAATLAGFSLSNSMAHIGHTLGHSLGAVFHVPHGSCVGCFLPYTLQYCMSDPSEENKTAEILGKTAKQLGFATWDDDDNEAANELIDKVKKLQKEVGFPSKLQDLKIPRNELENNMDTLISLCYQSPICTAGPRSPSTEEWQNLFTYAYEGKDVDF